MGTYRCIKKATSQQPVIMAAAVTQSFCLQANLRYFSKMRCHVIMPQVWSLLPGTFGLLFGALRAPVYAFVGGWAYALS